MKKIMCYVLVLCMLFGMSITVSADSLEEMQISELTKNYLTISSSARYERGDVDLICDTVSSLSQERVNSLKEKVAQKVRKDSAANSIGIDADIGRYFSEKALYFKYLREENDSYVTDFKTIYGKPEITIDGDTAEVKIFQTIGMQYPDLDEESAISTNYVISLVRTEYGWKISNISSDDLFDNTHNMDFKAEEEIQKRQKLQTQPASIVAETTCPSIEELRAAAAANGAKVYSYNRTNAAYYSKQYTTSTRDVYAATEYYNKNFPNFAGPGDGGDCMNFASQCMFAGFGGSDEPNIRAYDPPMDRVGNSYDGQWYFDPAGSRSGSWTGTMTFQDYVEKSKTNYKNETNLFCNSYYTTSPVDQIYDYKNRLVGALVFVLDKDGDVGHAMVIGKVTGPSDSQIYVSAHTHDKKLVPLAECDSNHAFRIVVPEAFYLYSTPPAVRVTCNWKDNVPAGTTVTFSGNAERRSGGTCYRMAIEVIPPDKSTSSWSNGVMSTNSISHAFTLNQKGLYTIKIYAKETYNTSGNVSSTMTLRTY